MQLEKFSKYLKGSGVALFRVMFFMFRLVAKFGFQRFIALLLLATFMPVAILSEAGHLIPGIGGSCGCFKFAGTCSHGSNGDCLHDFYSHGHSEDVDHAVVDCDDSTEVSGVGTINCVERYCDCRCAVHEFCMLFNSAGIFVFILPIAGEIVTGLGSFNLLSLFCGFISLFQARAPPLGLV
ncbi:MAG: hypothetical protein LBK06_05745 [Planctomycetaceae bacterium]|nr:hypothetical protein [Planctomycetaceae bacterium]